MWPQVNVTANVKLKAAFEENDTYNVTINNCHFKRATGKRFT